MFQNYSNLLKKAFDAMTSLKGSNASVLDYFRTVGYEFLVLAIGLCYIAVIISIFAAPYGGCRAIFRKFLANHPWKRYSALRREYEMFIGKYNSLLYNTKHKAEISGKQAVEIICDFLEDNGINTEKAKEKMSAWLSVNGYSGELLYNLLKIGGIFLYGDGSLIDIRDEEVLKNSNFKDLLFPEAYGSKYAKRHIFFENDSATYMRFCYITKAILLYIGFIIVYLMFLIPLILLFMN